MSHIPETVHIGVGVSKLSDRLFDWQYAVPLSRIENIMTGAACIEGLKV